MVEHVLCALNWSNLAIFIPLFHLFVCSQRRHGMETIKIAAYIASELYIVILFCFTW